MNKLIPDFLPESVVSDSEIWDVSVTLNAGDRVGIYGPSGRGKSTLIHLLCGLASTYRGEVSYGPHTLHRGQVNPWPLLRRQVISPVLQDFHLVAELSGWGNVALLPQRAEGVDEAGIKAWCKRLEIDQLMDRPFQTWSKGQGQRLALLRALVAPAHWLLLDEPFSHLDPASQQQACELLVEVCDQRGCGWVLTHLQAVPELPCTQVLKV